MPWIVLRKDSAQDSDLSIAGPWYLRERQLQSSPESVPVVKGYSLRQKNGEKKTMSVSTSKKSSCYFDNSNVPSVQSYQLSKQVAVHRSLTPSITEKQILG